MWAIVIAAVADLYWSISGGGNMDSVHDVVAATLTELGQPAPTNVIQTMLMKDGYFVGHKFRYDGGWAVMRGDSGTIDFYDDEGKLLKTVAVEAEKGAAA